MTAQNRTTNKSAFEQSDVPVGTDYADLIDSFVSIVDTTAQSIASDLTIPNITINGIVSADNVVSSVIHINSIVLGAASTVLSTAQSSAIRTNTGQQGDHGVFGLITAVIGSTTVALMFMHKGTFL